MSVDKNQDRSKVALFLKVGVQQPQYWFWGSSFFIKQFLHLLCVLVLVSGLTEVQALHVSMEKEFSERQSDRQKSRLIKIGHLREMQVGRQGGYAHYLDCFNDFSCAYICQNLTDFTLYIFAVNYFHDNYIKTFYLINKHNKISNKNKGKVNNRNTH